MNVGMDNHPYHFEIKILVSAEDVWCALQDVGIEANYENGKKLMDVAADQIEEGWTRGDGVEQAAEQMKATIDFEARNKS